MSKSDTRKKRPATLESQIEQTTGTKATVVNPTGTDSIDPDWMTHLISVQQSLGEIGRLEQINLLDPASAALAKEQLTKRLDQLNSTLKRVRTVGVLLRDEKARQEQVLADTIETLDDSK